MKLYLKLKEKSDLKIDLDLIINEGPRVYVNSINIEGNTRTLDRVIRREVALSETYLINTLLTFQKIQLSVKFLFKLK